MKHFFLCLLALVLCVPVQAQTPARTDATELYTALQKLQVLGSALFVAAHPDDENTRMISYLSNHRKVKTTYLSITRGDGGQNLIGPEIEELLGVIRTQELLAARRLDGGEQRFTRANDFGYSKHPDETQTIWNREEVLADVVWTIRLLQPDVIINRFAENSAGRTHGHHTASALLSSKAFELAADPNAFPEQLSYVKPWQARRMFYNTSWWQYGSREAFDAVDKSEMVSADIGVYYPLKGWSNTEIAAASRSMHRCQGMGNSLTRGEELEYLEFLKGDKPNSTNDLFEGIDISWGRLQGGAPIGKALAAIEAAFKFDNPAASVPALLGVHRQIKALPDSYWKQVKLKDLEWLIGQCMGLYLEATANDFSAAPGEEIRLRIEAINRSEVKLELERVHFLPTGGDTLLNMPMGYNQSLVFGREFSIPANMEYSAPYWLKEPGELGMYRVDEQQLRGLPETPRILKVQFDCSIEGYPIRFTQDIVYKETDRVLGEVYRPFEVLPPAFANLENKVFVFADNNPKSVKLQVLAGRNQAKGRASLQLPEGWRSEPASQEFDIELKGGQADLEFLLFPPAKAAQGTFQVVLDLGGKKYNQELVLIEYEHIPTQSVLRPAEARIVKIDLQRAGQQIGYLMGAGDEIPNSLEQVGYQVTLLEERDLRAETLAQYDAVVVGIRAYNTMDRLKFLNEELLSYVEQGGTLLVQFNTTWGLKMPSEEMGPYPFKLGRGRVAVEEAEIRMIQPDHPVLNVPNRITQADFEGWVQERGLYFLDGWDERYVPILSSNDPGEDPRDGGMVIAQYGKGYYIYSGYAWFRQLPAGVPGAYRLFTNMISLGKTNQ